MAAKIATEEQLKFLDFFSEKEFRLELVDSLAGKIAKVLKAKNKNYTKLFDRSVILGGR